MSKASVDCCSVSFQVDRECETRRPRRQVQSERASVLYQEDTRASEVMGGRPRIAIRMQQLVPGLRPNGHCIGNKIVDSSIQLWVHICATLRTPYTASMIRLPGSGLTRQVHSFAINHSDQSHGFAGSRPLEKICTILQDRGACVRLNESKFTVGASLQLPALLE